jgi:DNA-binding MarR family transcriptional regulator
MMLSSGATTYRIDLLEKRGLLIRMPDPADRRGTLVRLTDEGKELIDKVVEAHLKLEGELLAVLVEQQREQLAKLLGQLSQASNL